MIRLEIEKKPNDPEHILVYRSITKLSGAVLICYILV